jgi:hypothetical protein
MLVLFTNRAAVGVVDEKSVKESEEERESRGRVDSDRRCRAAFLLSRFAFRAPSLFVRALSQIFTGARFSL